MGVLPWVWWYGFRRHTAYPLGSLTESLTNTVFGFMRAYVLLALWDVRPSLGGYEAADAVTFCFITQALIGPVQIFGGMDLTERIRNGDVAIDLYRPVGLQGWWLADDLGRAAGSLLLRAGPPLLAARWCSRSGGPPPCTPPRSRSRRCSRRWSASRCGTWWPWACSGCTTTGASAPSPW